MTFSTYALNQKITKEAALNGFDREDLKNAVLSISHQKNDDYDLACQFSELIVNNSVDLQAVAGDVVQFCKDAGEYIGG